MFKFNFSEETVDENNKEDTSSDDTPLKWYKASKINPTNEQINLEIKSDSDINLYHFNNIQLKHISLSCVIDQLMDDEKHIILQSESEHSDLIAAKYEGGLKIWECTNDLSQYLLDNLKDHLKNKYVLDLGCGAGVLGIIALLQDASVCFQDYNSEVINYVTIPNVLLNVEDKTIINKSCEFYSGDWKSFTEIIDSSQNKKFDYILTSETIYNTQNYSKLHSVFKYLLKENGKIYLAAKTYYFGVGGGIRQFEELIRKEGLFKSTVVWKSDSGVKREIIELTFV